ncbi:MAG: hypothetical protein WDM77_20010 [Steroidobacteraceae bacterium]
MAAALGPSSWRSLASANQTTQVERTRIEQLENQLGLLGVRSERLSVEQEQLATENPGSQLAQLGEQESQARARTEELGRAQSAAVERAQALAPGAAYGRDPRPGERTRRAGKGAR